jgi:hypothetical protein
MNHAACGLFMFSRHDGESVEAFEVRVKAAVSELGGGPVAWGENLSIELVDGVSAIEREAVTVVGGLPAWPADRDEGAPA